MVAGEVPVEKVWEDEDYFAIKDKYPKAEVHLLVIPKQHISKNEMMLQEDQSHWKDLMSAVFEVIRLKNLHTTGYKVVTYGAGFNHFDHEHVHVLGGSSKQPAD
jgi:histidine triad (HIT) family protein